MIKKWFCENKEIIFIIKKLTLSIIKKSRMFPMKGAPNDGLLKYQPCSTIPLTKEAQITESLPKLSG